MFGVDVSNWQEQIDWDRAVAVGGVEFAVVKMSESVDFLDPWFARNWAELARKGLPRGLYHYARPSRNSPSQETAYVLALLNRFGLAPGDHIYCDMEDPNYWGDAGAWSLDWLDTMRDALSYRPGIYTYPSYVPERSLNEARLAEYRLWWADYDGTKGPFRGPWAGADLWQTTAFATVPGIGVNIDTDTFDGDRAAWLKLGWGGGVVTGTPNPDPLTGFWIDPIFVPSYSLADHGRPRAGSAMYSDGVLRQWFEKSLLEWDGRGEPRRGALGHATGLVPGVPLDFPDVHPLV